VFGIYNNKVALKLDRPWSTSRRNLRPKRAKYAKNDRGFPLIKAVSKLPLKQEVSMHLLLAKTPRSLAACLKPWPAVPWVSVFDSRGECRMLSPRASSIKWDESESISFVRITPGWDNRAQKNYQNILETT